MIFHTFFSSETFPKESKHVKFHFILHCKKILVYKSEEVLALKVSHEDTISIFWSLLLSLISLKSLFLNLPCHRHHRIFV